MIDLPDAPWIREAEMYGMPDSEDVYCPVCGEENPEELFIDNCNEVLGCDCCMKRVDAYEWIMKHKGR